MSSSLSGSLNILAGHRLSVYSRILPHPFPVNAIILSTAENNGSLVAGILHGLSIRQPEEVG
jgi:hypothetical protein